MLQTQRANLTGNKLHIENSSAVIIGDSDESKGNSSIHAGPKRLTAASLMGAQSADGQSNIEKFALAHHTMGTSLDPEMYLKDPFQALDHSNVNSEQRDEMLEDDDDELLKRNQAPFVSYGREYLYSNYSHECSDATDGDSVVFSGVKSDFTGLHSSQYPESKSASVTSTNTTSDIKGSYMLDHGGRSDSMCEKEEQREEYHPRCMADYETAAILGGWRRAFAIGAADQQLGEDARLLLDDDNYDDKDNDNECQEHIILNEEASGGDDESIYSSGFESAPFSEIIEDEEEALEIEVQEAVEATLGHMIDAIEYDAEVAGAAISIKAVANDSETGPQVQTTDAGTQAKKKRMTFAEFRAYQEEQAKLKVHPPVRKVSERLYGPAVVEQYRIRF